MSMYNEEEYNKPLSLKIWAKMLPFLKPYRMKLATVMILMIISALIDVLFPILQGYAVNNFIMRSTTENLGWFAAAYFICVLIQTLIVIIFTRYAMEVEMNVGKDMRRDTFVHLQTLSFSYYNTTPVGYLMARTMSDTGRIASLIAWGLVDTLWAFCYVVGAFISMFMLNVRLALIVILVVPFIVVLTIFFQNKILHLNRKSAGSTPRFRAHSTKALSAQKRRKPLSLSSRMNRIFPRSPARWRKRALRPRGSMQSISR